MNKKSFLFIFLGVVVAGLICLGVGLAVYFLVSGNAVVTVVSLFASIAGGIMAGAGLIALLMCLAIMTFGRGNKNENSRKNGGCDKVIEEVDENHLDCANDTNEE